LGKGKKCARFRLRTRNKETAIDKSKKYYHELMAQQLIDLCPALLKAAVELV